MKKKQPSVQPQPHQPSEVIAMPVEGLTEEELAELEASPIPEATRQLDRLLPDDWPKKRTH